jgi:hypothetical protein
MEQIRCGPKAGRTVVVTGGTRRHRRGDRPGPGQLDQRGCWPADAQVNWAPRTGGARSRSEVSQAIKREIT